MAALAQANGVANPDLIWVGQALVIPSGGSPAKTQPEARPPAVSVPTPVVNVPYQKQIRGLYMTYFSLGSPSYREHIFRLLDTTPLNAVVMDVKGDRGWLAYPSSTQNLPGLSRDYYPMPDVAQVLRDLREQNIYTIARIVVFKDDPLARARPSLAIKDSLTGGPWIDSEGLAWTDPFRREVWSYNIAIAVEAARLGFDEIQFDYVRFPTDGAISTALFAEENNAENRSRTILGFLAQAQKELRPWGVKLAVDVFGYTVWWDNEMGIGQRLEDIALYVDVISPMLYPSTFREGIPGYRYAVAYPYEIVYQSTAAAVGRLRGTDTAVRPWIQDFPDYAFDGRAYTAQDVMAQQRAAQDAGASGWMLWDPRVKYTEVATTTP